MKRQGKKAKRDERRVVKHDDFPRRPLGRWDRHAYEATGGIRLVGGHIRKTTAKETTTVDGTHQSLHSAHSIIGPSSSFVGFLQTQYTSSFFGLLLALPLPFVACDFDLFCDLEDGLTSPLA